MLRPDLGVCSASRWSKVLVPEEFLEASEYDDNQDVVAKVAYHWNRKRQSGTFGDQDSTR
ncbi:MAG: hypothetical protein ACLSH6_08120 [Limosilactobacillus pontis]